MKIIENWVTKYVYPENYFRDKRRARRLKVRTLELTKKRNENTSKIW